jgi:hypothetical protein
MAQGEKQGGSGTGSTPHKGGSQPQYTPNDDRAIVKNPTNPAYDADQANRKTQQGG